jgi:DNA replication initiation complex subunit (GINS family)
MEDLVENKVRDNESRFIVKIKDNNTNEEYEKWITTKDINKEMNEFTASNPNTSWKLVYEYKGDGV